MGVRLLLTLHLEHPGTCHSSQQFHVSQKLPGGVWCSVGTALLGGAGEWPTREVFVHPVFSSRRSHHGSKCRGSGHGWASRWKPEPTYVSSRRGRGWEYVPSCMSSTRGRENVLS